MNMDTRTLDLRGLPEPIARGLEVVVEMARNLTEVPEPINDPERELPVWPLGAVDPLTREDIYDDYQCRC